MNIGRACGIFMNIDSDNFTDNEKLIAINDVLKEMITYNGITKDAILKAFRWFYDWAGEEMTADAPDTNVGEWIPCSLAKPTNHGNYLVTSKGSTWVAEWYNDTWWGIELETRWTDVEAWMPLPEPYKESE